MITKPHRLVVPCVIVLVLAMAPANAAKKPLDHDSYDRWNSVTQSTISNDGKWVLYTVNPAKGTPVVRAVEIATGAEFTLKDSRNARFTFDGKHLVYLMTIKPPAQATKPGEKKTPPAKQPAAKSPASKTPSTNTPAKTPASTTSLVILELATGRKITVDGVKSFSVPSKGKDWLAYHLSQDLKVEIEKPGKSNIREVEPVQPKTEAKPVAGNSGAGDQRRGGRRRTSGGTTASAPATLAIRNLATGMELRFPNVEQFTFSETGNRIAWSAKGKSDNDSGIFVFSTKNLEVKQIKKYRLTFRNLTFDPAGKQLVYFAASSSSPGSTRTLQYWNEGDKTAVAILTPGKNGFPKDRKVAPTSQCGFSQDGTRVFFSTVQNTTSRKPTKKPASKTSSTGVQVDIWHWKDPDLQPMQLLQAARERNRSYLAVIHLHDKKVVQLATEDLPSVTVGDERNAAVAVGTSDLPYKLEASWEYPGYNDIYLVDVKTGRRQRVLKKLKGGAALSPQAKFLYWWDGQKRQWRTMNIATKQIVDVTKGIPHPLYDEEHDRPYIPSAYGTAGWMKDDAALLVYDRYDLWAVDPTGKAAPRCVTDGFGRKHELRFRRMRFDREERSIPPKGELLLSAFHDRTKATGVYRDAFGRTQMPQKLVMKDEMFRIVGKARNTNDLLVVRSTFQRSPDYWHTTTDFKSLRRITDANPQQKEYLWGKSELVAWKANDGTPLQGILIKPEGFDPKKKYPMIVYFYERMSNRLHSYIAPATIRASINWSFYASRGYLVFVPDIVYKTGAPGESAVNCVLPGVESLIKKGFVNEKAIGVQGHSWGGYQTAYLVTRTNMFAAAEAGAPVSNMTSAYGGIRWGSGKVRMFQYERTQSRIGDSLWKAREKYVANSPLFRAPHVNTPLLILHNDKDGAVPWYQGIELFVALRRLGKPAWMLNYNGEDHGLTKAANRKDFTIRMQQFFDHYLKDAPAPVWLAHGVPAVDKGKVTGLDLVKPASQPKSSVGKSPKKPVRRNIPPATKPASARKPAAAAAGN